jgi:hypothetical protein
MLLEEGMISEDLVENKNSWKHSGFSVHYCTLSGNGIMISTAGGTPNPMG